DAEFRGGPEAVIVVLAQGLVDALDLRLFLALSQGHRLFRRTGPGWARWGLLRVPGCADLVGEIVDVDLGTGTQRHRPFERVAQLADVPRPVVLLQRGQRVGSDPGDVGTVAGGALPQELPGQRRDRG